MFMMGNSTRLVIKVSPHSPLFAFLQGGCKVHKYIKQGGDLGYEHVTLKRASFVAGGNKGQSSPVDGYHRFEFSHTIPELISMPRFGLSLGDLEPHYWTGDKMVSLRVPILKQEVRRR